MSKPEFITLTGADDATSIDGMLALASQYPIEWGILFSPARQGTGRYPSLAFMKKVTNAGLLLAAHVCGDYSRLLIDSGNLPDLEPLLSTGRFRRVQINTANPASPQRVMEWARTLGIRPILQSRMEKDFPASRSVHWLFDRSGGRGIQAQVWPIEHDPERIVGFAGGISPRNAAERVAILESHAERYWIDMESGIRDALDRFDLEACRMVCEAVYGEPPVSCTSTLPLPLPSRPTPVTHEELSL